MKIAFAGKGGAGKTSITAWLADHLARRGENVWLVDADTALSLGQACGLDPAALPAPLAEREDIIRQHIGQGYMSLNPDVSGLPDTLSVDAPLGGPALPGVSPGRKRLLVMGTIAGATNGQGGGCACAANALLKAVLAHLILERREWVLVDLEAGVEHLGRGTVADVDALVVVSEPSLRALSTAGEVSRLARGLGLSRQVLALNRCEPDLALPTQLAAQLNLQMDLPERMLRIPALAGLKARQLESGSVLGLPEDDAIGALCDELLERLGSSGTKAPEPCRNMTASVSVALGAP
ncbi:MAG TPA: ArsA-related P-loop ATPase [Humidesulfovibrio sp.]|uniref:ATP-binding protein n=1 Tax=Humidesulfovibrio sp. TaxID=2910988 RepID=UPI002C96AF3E|nr:ArsA-related P-loop ATPase [Humidesulfovibrio sp.]HWR04192.1 ArsA-related P-loop ATPase [Humidesulfovibrio sp.]